jgi:hypothetical protein
MFKQLLCSIMLMTFSFTSIAAPYSQNKSISSIMTKYDYLMTSHPQSHEEAFQADTMKKFKMDLSKAVKDASKEELLESFDDVLAEIPTKEKREVYLKLLKNSSKEEMTAFLASPRLLTDALQGQSANFFVDGEPMISAVLILIVGIIIMAVVIGTIEDSKYEFFASFEVAGGSCTYLDEGTRAAMKENALSRCASGATHPDTCVSTGFTTHQNSERYDDDYQFPERFYSCTAGARADKIIE